MKTGRLQLLTLALCADVATAGVRAASAVAAGEPIALVLKLLSKMEATALEQGKESQTIYNEFAKMCRTRSTELHHEVKTGRATAENLEAAIEKATDKISELSMLVEERTAKLTGDEADVKATTLIRNKEAADISAEQDSLTHIIDVIGRAIAALRNPGFLQERARGLTEAISVLVSASTVGSSEDVASLTALVQGGIEAADESAFADSAEAAFLGDDETVLKSKVETLESLLHKAEIQLKLVRKKGTSASNNFKLFALSREHAIARAQKEMDAARQNSAEAGERKATAEADLTMTRKEIEQAQKDLAQLKHECMAKAADFEEEMKSRDEEMNALAAAKKAIREVAGSPPSAAEQATSLLQVGLESGGDDSDARDGDSEDENPRPSEAANIVRRLGQRLHSAALTQLASRLSLAVRSFGAHGQDTFAKVRAMISAMIMRLQAEGDAEAKQKAYCDKEMETTKNKKQDREKGIEKLTTKIDMMTAESVRLTEEVAALQSSMAETAKTQAEMDAIRQQEHSENLKCRKQLEEGLTATKFALTTLRTYYSKDDRPTTAAGSNSGADGVIAALELVESDLQKALNERVSNEEAAQSAYEEQTNENKISSAVKQKDMGYKMKAAKSLEKSVAEHGSDRDGEQEELEAVNEIFAKLTEECVAKPDPYEEKAERRTREIAGLKEALQHLEGATVPAFLQTAQYWRGVGRHNRHHAPSAGTE